MPGDGSGYRVAGPRSRRDGEKVILTIRRDGAKLAEPAPDPPGTDITGGWEGTNVFLRLNRVGNHIEGWHTNYRTKTVTPFGGDVGGQEVFGLLESPAGQNHVGTISVISTNELALSWHGQPSQALRRVDSGVGLSDNALEAFESSQRQAIVDEQRQPLSSADRRAAVEGFRAIVLAPFINRYYALPSGNRTAERAARAAIVREVDQHTWSVFRQLHPDDQRKARPWALLVLRQDQHSVNGRTQSLLQWLQEMVHVATVLSSDPAPYLREYFSIVPSGQLHYYRLILRQRLLNTTELSDLVTSSGKSALSIRPGLGGGYYGGTLQVSELPSNDPNDRQLWEITFPISIAQFGVGLGVSFGSDNDAVISTPYPWQPNNFPGTIKLVDLSVGAGVSFGATGCFISGDGTYPELIVDYSGFSPMLGAGAGLTEAIGTVGPAGQPKPTPFNVSAETSYAAAASARTAIHFPFGRAELTAEGRQLLRVFAAQELALLRAGYAKLLIESHADRVDSKEYNELLTKCRSWNCYQALKDILGSSIHHSTERRLIGLGETGATIAGDKDSVENPAWRRSDIFMNGRLVLRLRGEGQSLTR